MDPSSRQWADLLHLANLHTLAIAEAMLRIVEDPSLGTEGTRQQLLAMIEQLEYGIARFEEHLV